MFEALTRRQDWLVQPSAISCTALSAQILKSAIKMSLAVREVYLKVLLTPLLGFGSLLALPLLGERLDRTFLGHNPFVPLDFAARPVSSSVSNDSETRPMTARPPPASNSAASLLGSRPAIAPASCNTLSVRTGRKSNKCIQPFPC